MFCLLVFCTAIENSGHLEPGVDAVEPLALFVAPIVINACYTLGWLVELGLHLLRFKVSNNFGYRLFRVGLIFSLVIVSLPAVIWSVVWLFS